MTGEWQGEQRAAGGGPASLCRIAPLTHGRELVKRSGLSLRKQTLLGIALAILVPSFASGQGPRDADNWNMPRGESSHQGVQPIDRKLNSDTAAQQFKFLWKLQLGDPSGAENSFSEPLLRQRLINSRGFKDLVYWGNSNTLYAVDDELGRIEWQKHFDIPNDSATGECGAAGMQILMEPPPTINFHARHKPGTPYPPPPPPVLPSERKLGQKAGSGFFGLQGIYALTSDGYMHEQVLSTGDDFAPAVKFLPGSGADAYGLNVFGDTIVAVTGHHCGDVQNGAWALQMTTSGYPVSHYSVGRLDPLDLTGMALAANGTGFLVTGPGSASEHMHPNSVVALNVKNGLQVTDWYTPKGGYGSVQHVSPVVFNYQGKELVIAPGADGRIVLLDAASLGGADHHTALFESSPFSQRNAKHSWDGFAAWQDKQGNAWVIASISAPVSMASSSATTHGETSHGAYVAFKIEGDSGKPTLTPVWVSRDLLNPAPPVVTNDVVIALSGGDSQSHAVLYVLDAANGKALYSSTDEIPTYTHFSGVSFGNSHAYFTDHNHVLYAFGIGMEH